MIELPKGASRVLFIDPGIGGTGWALYEFIGGCSSLQAPKLWGVIRATQDRFWFDGILEIVDVLEILIDKHCPDLLVIEHPEYWPGSATSYASVAGGSLFKLVLLVGQMSYIAAKKCRLQPQFPSPAAWKGQLPKDVVIKRIKDRFPHITRVRNHEADALGMGLAAQGKL
jgi:Holliday junction resolvasome RuvABC endonuclease subunit